MRSPRSRFGSSWFRPETRAGECNFGCGGSNEEEMHRMPASSLSVTSIDGERSASRRHKFVSSTAASSDFCTIVSSRWTALTARAGSNPARILA